jgi:hypothetical protein
MKPRELVDHIRSGPAELGVLEEPLRFRRRTRSSPCDFDEFIQALQSSETIRTVRCGSHREFGITEDEWVLLIKTLGRIRDLDHLRLNCSAGSHNFHPFQVVADAVSNAQSLRKLRIFQVDEMFPRYSSGPTALASALREHTALQELTWLDLGSRRETAQGTTLDPVLRALSACSHLRKVFIATKYASADAMKNLLQLRPATELCLVLETEHWLAVADDIRQGRCKIKDLSLSMLQVARSEATEAVKAIASAIRLDRNLKHLTLQMAYDFTDEAGVALAEALTVNKTLRSIILLVHPLRLRRRQVQDADALRAPIYDAFSAMLRVNTSLVLELPPACRFSQSDAY